MKNRYSSILIFLAAISLLISCRKDVNSSINSGQATLRVNLSKTIGEENTNITNKSSNKANTVKGFAEYRQNRKIHELSKDYLLITEFIPESSNSPKYSTNNSITIKNGNKAVTTTEMSLGVKYVLVVYDNNGDYVTERSYVYGDEDATSDLVLTAGVTYQFVAYSLNDVTNLPTIIYSNPSAKKLSEATIEETVDKDLLYYKSSIQLVAGQDNYLNIIFSRLFNTLTLNIDASLTGFDINEFKVDLLNIQAPTANFNLETKTFSNTGTVIANDHSLNFTYSTINIGSSQTIRFASVLNSIKLKVLEINIGDLTWLIPEPIDLYDVAIFDNQDAVKGHAYTLNFRIVPNDRYLVHNGESAVIIGGYTWMQYNLGSVKQEERPATASPAIDQTFSTDMYGDYYQFGQPLPFATGSSTYTAADQATAITNGWIPNNNPGPLAWSNISSSNPYAEHNGPIKTINDPCPDGWRIPTSYELFDFILLSRSASTVPYAELNNQADPNDNYIYIRSLRKNNVYLIFPTQGFYNSDGPTFLGLYEREGFLHTTNPSNPGVLYFNGSVHTSRMTGDPNKNEIYALYTPSTGDASLGGAAGPAGAVSTAGGYPIRCIAKQSFE